MMKKAEELGNDWAEADAAHGLLEDTKKTLLAQITNGFLEKGKILQKLWRWHPKSMPNILNN